MFTANLDVLVSTDALSEDPFGLSGSGSAETSGGGASQSDNSELGAGSQGWGGGGGDSSAGGGSAGVGEAPSALTMHPGPPDAGGSPVFPTAAGLGNQASPLTRGHSPVTTNLSPFATPLPLNLTTPPITTSPTGPIVINSSPVLDSVWRFGPVGHGRLLIEGSLANTAPLGTQVTLDFYAQDHGSGSSWLLGSKTLTQTKAGAISFTVNLEADVPQGTWIAAAVHGRPDGPNWSQGVALPGGTNDPGIPGKNLLDTVTVPVGTAGESITLESPGHPLEDVKVFHPPGLDAALPMGLIGFAVTNVPAGGTAIVRMILPNGVQASSYYKHDPRTGLLTPFNFDGKTGAEIHGNVITLHLVDGGPGDEDGLANGVIVDPGAPGTVLLQPGTVAVVPAATDGELVTLKSPSDPFASVQTYGAPASGVVLPLGLFGFTVTGVPVGGSAQVQMIVPNDIFPSRYIKQNPVSGALTDFGCCNDPGATINGHTITLNLTDGGAGDADGLANGIIVDPGGPGAGTIVIPCDNGLTGWTVIQTGGSGAGIGTVTYNSSTSTFTITEGNSFDVGLKHDFTIPTAPNILTFDYSNPTFGPGTAGRMNDAFEAAFVDANGNSLVPTIAPGRNAFFNITNIAGTQSVATAPGVTVQNGIVNLDISKLFAGTTGTLIFRLVNNDSDTTTTVTVFCHPPPSVTVALANDTAPTGPNTDQYRHDLLTNDPTVTGTATDSAGVTKLEAKIDAGAYTDITSVLNVNQYTWNPGALAAGSHTITIRATDAVNIQTTASLTFTVNVPPVANAGGNQTINEGSLATFDGSNSTDSDDPIYSYVWTFPYGAPASGAYSSFRFLQPGSYTVTLAVTDTAGSIVTNSATITVTNLPAVVATIADQSITETSTATFQTTFTDPGPLDTHTASINWGDGTAATAGTLVEESGGTGGVALTPGTVSGSHVFAEEGLFKVVVTVTDNGNLSGTSSFWVTVTDAPPTLTISGASTVTAGDAYTLNLSAVGAADPLSAWTINWGDGTTTTTGGTAPSLVHTYNTASVYTITATGTTDDGTVNANQLVVTVGSPATVAISGSGSTNEGSLYTLNLINGGLAISTWNITWRDNSTTGPLSGNPSSTTHTYADGPQTYTITGTAQDSQNVTHNVGPLTITVNNVGPTVTPAAAQTDIKNTSFTLTVASFTDPGFTSSTANTTEAPFTASINWGDNTTTTNPTISVTQGSATQLTSGTVTASHTYTAAGNYTVSVTVSNDESASASASFVIHVLASGPVKFFTIDKSQHAVFEYDAVGNAAGSFNLSTNNQNAWGIATNAAMSTLWMVDANKNVQVYVYGTDGSLKGYWLADKSVKSAQDIATDGSDIWILDNSASSPKVRRFAGGASWTSGPKDGYLATSSFTLDPANGFPTGMVTDGTTIWVTDKTSTVFVYNLSGAKLGSWTLDAANTTPTGITLNPSYSRTAATDLWVVDRLAAQVFRYAGASTFTSGSHSATSSFALASTDTDAQGIADPVTLTVAAPANNASFPQGNPVLVSGTATPSSGAFVTDVTVNGTTATVDAGNNFFQQVTANPGQNTFTVTGTDSTGSTATSTVNVSGTAPVTATPLNPGAIDFSMLSDVTGSFTVTYARTSFNNGTSVVYADFTANDVGTYTVRSPFLVGVRHISAPSVRVRNNTGVMADGTPYYDLSSLLPVPPAGGALGSIGPGQSSQTGTLAFYDPEGLQFTYDLVFLGRLNHPPRWTSVPVVTAVAGTTYSYTPSAVDPDGDPLRFSVVSGPSAMAPVDWAKGPITWLTSTSSTGTYPIRLRVSDNQGGYADQTFILSVLSSTNFPPVFTSTPVVDANVNTPYTYQATASDLDNDALTFSLATQMVQGQTQVLAPAGMSITSSGLVTWTPTAGQLGSQSVTLKVTDAGNLSTTQAYTIYVQQQPGNHPPIFISTPVTTIPATETYLYPSKALDPDGDPLTYSLTTFPTGMTISAGTGMIAWLTTSANAGNSYSVTVQAVDGRGGVATQSFTVTVTAAVTQTGALYGTKYADPNNDGARDAAWLYPAPTTLGPIALQQVALSDSPQGIEFDAALNSMLISTQVTVGTTSSTVYKLLRADGTTTSFATVTGVAAGDGNVFAVAPPGNTAGFVPGDVFLPAGQAGAGPPLIARITNNGATVINPWVTLEGKFPSCGSNGSVAFLYFDQTGVFGNNLLVVTSTGHVYKITAAGVITALAMLPTGYTFSEGSLITFPNNATLYGPLAGKLLVTEATHSAYTVDTTGTVVNLDPSFAAGDAKGLDNADGVALVPAAANFFTITDSSPSVWVALGAQFAPIIGQLVTSNVAAGTFNRVYYDSTSGTLKTQLLTMVGSSALPSDLDPMAFLPAGLGPVQSPIEPGLPNWTIFLDTNNNGVLDAGEPSTTTDVNGNYSFLNLALGTYNVREVPNSSWTQTAPTPVPPGKYTVTLTSTQPIVSGLDFGNHQNPTNLLPHISTTAGTTATVGQIYRYNAAASDTDGDPLTWDLPVHPAGMVVDPSLGIVVWVPTADEVGTANVLLRVQDGRGGVDLQFYQITVVQPDTDPVITSTAPSPAVVGVAYQYAVKAQDAEHDTLTYTLGTVSPAPATPNSNPLTLNSSTGVLTWTPVSGDATKTFSIPITVSDGRGMSASQTVSLLVNSSGSNGVPTITSTARTQIAIGQKYFYQVVAGDTDGDVLSYSLTAAPTGMTINATTGMISWTPTSSQFGNNTATVQVSDGRGGTPTQTFTFTVTDQAANRAPVITSSPPLLATVGRMYSYNLTGYDPDNDPVAWNLVSGPWGMSLSPSLGTLRWLPTAIQVGPQAVTVQLVDDFGAKATQTWTITVRGAEPPPLITSEPPLTATMNKLYTYAVQATDADGDSLTYSLGSGSPSWLSINQTTGLIQGTPTIFGGPFSVTVQVSDGFSGTATQTWGITVGTSVNYAPVITSNPVTTAILGQSYSYQLTVTDRDNDTQTYSLSTTYTGSGPPTISTSGLVSWTTPVAGTYTFTVTVTDAGGLKATQIYSLLARTDSPPTINSSAVTSVTLGLTYRYDVQASDADSDPLTYSLAGAPTGMTIDASTGSITWTPTATGTSSGISVTVSDPFASSAPQTFSVTVNADTQAPSVELQLSANPIGVGNQETFLVLASDNVGVTSLTLTVNGTNLSIDSKGQAFMTMSTIGNYTVTATAKDAAGNTGTATATLAVNNPTGTPPTISLTAPLPDANGNVFITAPTAVTGTVSDDHNGISYTVSVIPYDGSPAVQIGSGSTTTASSLTLSNVTFDPTMLGNGDYNLEVKATDTFDPTMLANGDYNLEVKATDVDDNLTTTLDQHVSVTAHLKLGREQLSVTDLTIPVNGIPITITRSYDSLAAGVSGDFGYGWRLGFGDAKLEVNLGTLGDAGYGGYPAFLTGTRVTVTMAGKEREGFTFTPYLQAYDSFALITYWHPAFTPDSGVFDTLTVPDALLSQDSNGNFYSINPYTGGYENYNPADPYYGGTYTATDLSGLASTIDANSGKLLSMTARNGNSLNFSSTGITSNTGKAVTFTRDPAGHITAITDPRRNSVKYGYDVNGNLISVTDRVGDPPTNYTYDPNHAHYLNGITDPLGVQQLSATFDTSGRITQMTDAKGSPLNFAYNTTALTQTITDPNLPSGSQTATVGFDNRGDPLNVTDPTGAQGSATFNNSGALRDLPNSVTQVLRNPGGGTTNLTTTLGFDTTGDVTSMTDPTGAITRLTYGPFGIIQTISDALGNTTTKSYDNSGNLLSTISATGLATFYGYDSKNELTKITQGTVIVLFSAPSQTGAVTKLTYDTFGNLATSTIPTGVTTTDTMTPTATPPGRA